VSGLWDYAAYVGDPRPYGDKQETYAAGLGWLAGLGLVEDWGAGMAWGRHFIPAGHYKAIDSSPSSAPFVDVVADLRTYLPDPQPGGIFMRHVLEHNVEWQAILANAVASFRERLVLVIFTPFSETETHPLQPAHPLLDYSFRKADLDVFFAGDGFVVREEHLETVTQYRQEHIYYVQREPVP
jgi:hypothetical protein